MARLLPSNARPPAPWNAKHAGDDYGAAAEPGWREIDWREHVHQAQVLGRRVNYCDYGGGDELPIVFVHGWGGNWQNWLEQLPRFGQERRVVALDLPGHGDSEMPAERVTISGFGRAVDGLCEHLGIERAVFVGNSMGGFTAAEVAIQCPPRVERLMLVNAAGITTNELRREPLLTMSRALAGLTLRRAARMRAGIVRPRLRLLFYGGIMRHPSLIPTDLLFEISKGAHCPAFVPALEAILEYDFRDRLPDIQAPTLIVWGRNDMLVPVKDADAFEESIPGARKVVMEDTGHVPMIERPPTFNDCLAEWLASRPEEFGEEADGEGEQPEVAEAA